MEPISAVGIAAGAVQFADVGVRALIGTVKLLKQLKETPKRMAELLQDVDKSIQRIHELLDAMQQPNSFSAHLSATQSQRVMTNIQDAHQATIDLQHDLEPLFRKGNTAGHGWGKKTWRSVVSVSMEPGISQKISRITRLNQETTNEMHLICLEIQAKLENTSNQTQKSVEAFGQDVVSQLNLLTMSHKTIQQVSQDSQSQLTQLQSDVSSIKDICMDRNTSGRQQLHTSIEAVPTDISSDNRQACDSTINAIQHDGLQTRLELTSLRNLVLSLVTGNSSPLVIDQSIASQLTSECSTNLATQVGKQLIKTPSSLADVCERTTLTTEPIESDFDQDHRPKKNKGNCTCVRTHSVRHIGSFGTAYDFRSSRSKKCPYHRSDWESWSYSFFVRLLPIVQRTVGITFAANFGAGGSSIGPSLTYFGTVQRSKSPAFQLLDEFPDRFASKTSARVEGQFMHSGSGNIMFYFKWNLELLKTEIPELCCELSRLLSVDRSCASHNDEYGNTLLHAIYGLIRCLGSNFNHFSDPLTILANRVIDAGVQVNAVSQKINVKYTTFDYTSAIPRASTIFDFAANIAMEHPQPIKSFPLYETIGTFLDDHASEVTLDIELWNDLELRRAALFLSRRYPWFLNYCGYGQLEEAIARRSLTKMNHILQKISCTQYSKELSYKRLLPVELAIGWSSGLQKLLNVGFDADEALRLSMYMNDLESIKIILGSENFLKEKYGWTKVLMGLLRKNIKPSIQQIVIQTFSSRRQALAALAIKELPEEAIIRLGLRKEKTLDAAALNVYHALQNTGVNIPKGLNPVLCDSSGNHSSIYHFFFGSFGYDGINPRLLELLYINGFELVDLVDRDEQTPLYLICKGFKYYWSEEKISPILWLLENGASPKFSGAGSYPNVLFYIALGYAGYIRNGSPPFSSNFKLLIQRSASLCDPLCSDGCQCHCSSAGCLPFYNFWKCDDRFGNHEHCKSITSATLFDALHKWIFLCGIDEAQSKICYEESFRLEVFDRLGMAHTCCRHKGSLGKEYRSQSLQEDGNQLQEDGNQLQEDGNQLQEDRNQLQEDRNQLQEDRNQLQEDRNQLQEEDTELKEQLDLIIQGYQNRYKNYAGGLNDFWKGCMQDFNGIIPELMPEERCRQRCLSPFGYFNYKRSREYPEKEKKWLDLRMKKERETLTKMGYLGLDFIDVIHLHFADSLDPRPTSSA